ncbi:hypothetical protein JD844_017099 [Phrynosoma platyrhinos]|uniref:Cadherin domain-containing protein n=1 Tax=Phrynosoma platyrhinos TaxID=52577 RepID=A0ABQ7SLG4_PHRPL|nr:hypothetical protein JD844_017099 [Phrynosoma platyrhinos]
MKMKHFFSLSGMENQHKDNSRSLQRQVSLILLLSLLCIANSEHIQYSVPEEMEKGSIVGNLAKDLRLNTGQIANNNLHILSLGEKQYFTISAENGNLYVNERIDREELCGATKSCVINFEVMAENPVNIFHITIEIQDINDNAPHFVHGEIKLEINELTLPGTTFILEEAEDLDIGVNALQDYHINNNKYFILEIRETEDGKKYAELVLEKHLDHESESSFHLILTALDGGRPPKTGTATIWITVIDANDNPPVFTQKTYMVTLRENAPSGTLVVQVKATDRDAGSYGQISYDFRNIPERARQKFNLDTQNGKITVKEALDFEEIDKYLMTVEARDGGGLAAQCKVEIKLLDVNDNTPEVMLASLSSPIPEDSAAGTLVALINIKDRDSGDNGEITCHLKDILPFKMVTSRTFLERDAVKQKLVILVKDNGQPPLSSTVSLNLVFAENFQEALPEINSQSRDPDYQSDLQFYLVLALALISFLFLLTVILAILTKLRRSGHTKFLQCFGPVPHSNNAVLFPPNYEEGTLPYSYQLCLSSESRIQEFTFPAPSVQSAENISCNQKSHVLSTADQGNIINIDLDKANMYFNMENEIYTSTASTVYQDAKVHNPLNALVHKLETFIALNGAAPENIQYSIPEEMEKGSIVGNLAKDLRLYTGVIANSNLHILSLGEKQYFTVSAENGNLYVNDRIDREEICGDSKSCPISFKVMSENPVNIFHISVEIQDINDNAPNFLDGDIKLQISESTLPGTTYILEQAEDPDIGVNALQDYHLENNKYFTLDVKDRDDGKKYAKLVLNQQLDHESENSFHLIFMAVDGGKPPKTGTATLWITVIDANDNSPVFTKELYMVNLRENTPSGSLVVQVKATDRDAGSNGQISYGFRNIQERARQKFNLDSQNGKITIKQDLDFEKTEKYVLTVEARDGGGLVAHSNVEIKLLDDNDNTPEVILASLSSPIPEDSAVGTLVALISVNDRDSGDNGEITCHLTSGIPFKIVSANNDFYKLLTDGPLDRESTPEYNITITATDKGTPPLSTEKTISLKISDINDNSPAFERSSYTAFVPENNPLGASRSFDYEQFREFQVEVRAQDGGSPPLSSTTTVKVFILDQNDKSPQILYPSQGLEGSALFEMVPRSAEEGYLVTKVVAVDADSGHNAWLSYHLVQATEPGLFSIGVHNGEIRTSRTFLERDAVKQRLVILVKDNGQPPLSSTVSLNLVFAENFQEALPEINNHSRDPEYQSDIQFYLVLALTLISFLFLLTIILAILTKLRRSGSPKFLQCFGPVPHSNNAVLFPPNYEEGTLPYSYQLCLSSESRIQEFTFPAPSVQTAENISGHRKSDVLLTADQGNVLNIGMDKADGGIETREYLAIQNGQYH